jgi:hypothetical protein
LFSSAHFVSSRSQGFLCEEGGKAVAAMVYYFTSNVVSPAGFVYVGKDKFESEAT